MQKDNLKKLHTSLVDNEKGYLEAAKDAETPSLKAFFTEMSELKERNHSDLHAALTKLGEKPDKSGSFMSTVHKTVVKVRAATTGLQSALPSFVMGEEEVVGQYDVAIKDCTSDPATLALLNSQKENLVAKIAVMKAMKK